MDATLDSTVSSLTARGIQVSHRSTPKTTTPPPSRTAARRLKVRAMFDVLERLDLSTTPLSDRGRTALQTLVKLCFPDRVAVAGNLVILTVNASLGLIARAASWSRVTERDVANLTDDAVDMLTAAGLAVDDALRTRQRRRKADEPWTAKPLFDAERDLVDMLVAINAPEALDLAERLLAARRSLAAGVKKAARALKELDEAGLVKRRRTNGGRSVTTVFLAVGKTLNKRLDEPVDDDDDDEPPVANKPAEPCHAKDARTDANVQAGATSESSPVGHICPTFPMDSNHGPQQQAREDAAAAVGHPTDPTAEPADRAEAERRAALAAVGVAGRPLDDLSRRALRPDTVAKAIAEARRKPGVKSLPGLVVAMLRDKPDDMTPGAYWTKPRHPKDALDQVADGRDAADLDVFAAVFGPMSVVDKAKGLRFARERLAIPTTVADENLAALGDVRRVIVEAVARHCGVARRS